MIRKIAVLISILAWSSIVQAQNVALIRMVDVEWRTRAMPLAQVQYLRNLLVDNYAGQDVVIILDTEKTNVIDTVKAQIDAEMDIVRNFRYGGVNGSAARVPSRIRVLSATVLETDPSSIAPENANVTLDLVDPGRLGLGTIEIGRLDASQNLMNEATREFLGWAEMLAGIESAPYINAIIRIGNTHLSNLIFLLALQSPQQGGAIALGTHASYQNLVNNTFVATRTHSRRPLSQVLDALARYREAASKNDTWTRDSVLAQTGITLGEMNQWIDLAERGVYAYHESLLQFAPRMTQVYNCKKTFN